MANGLALPRTLKEIAFGHRFNALVDKVCACLCVWEGSMSEVNVEMHELLYNKRMTIIVKQK